MSAYAFVADRSSIRRLCRPSPSPSSGSAAGRIAPSADFPPARLRPVPAPRPAGRPRACPDADPTPLVFRLKREGRPPSSRVDPKITISYAKISRCHEGADGPSRKCPHRQVRPRNEGSLSRLLDELSAGADRRRDRRRSWSTSYLTHVVMPGPRIKSGGDPGIHGRCKESRVRPAPSASLQPDRRAYGDAAWMAGSSPAMTGWWRWRSKESRVRPASNIQTGRQWNTPGLDPAVGYDGRNVAAPRCHPGLDPGPGKPGDGGAGGPRIGVRGDKGTWPPVRVAAIHVPTRSTGR